MMALQKVDRNGLAHVTDCLPSPEPMQPRLSWVEGSRGPEKGPHHDIRKQGPT